MIENVPTTRQRSVCDICGEGAFDGYETHVRGYVAHLCWGCSQRYDSRRCPDCSHKSHADATCVHEYKHGLCQCADPRPEGEVLRSLLYHSAMELVKKEADDSRTWWERMTNRYLGTVIDRLAAELADRPSGGGR